MTTHWNVTHWQARAAVTVTSHGGRPGRGPAPGPGPRAAAAAGDAEPGLVYSLTVTRVTAAATGRAAGGPTPGRQRAATLAGSAPAAALRQPGCQ